MMQSSTVLTVTDVYASSFDFSAASPADAARAEIAALAARWIAEEGMDYGTAKRKAAQQVLDSASRKSHLWPDNEQVEAAVREHLAIFQAELHPARLACLREVAELLMQALAAYRPYLTGAVLNGTATQFSDLYLYCFADNPKDLPIFLLNHGLDFEASESPHFAEPRGGEAVETVSFLWRGQFPEQRASRELAQRYRQLCPGTSGLGVHLMLYSWADERLSAPKASAHARQRANLAQLQQLLQPLER